MLLRLSLKVKPSGIPTDSDKYYWLGLLEEIYRKSSVESRLEIVKTMYSKLAKNGPSVK